MRKEVIKSENEEDLRIKHTQNSSLKWKSAESNEEDNRAAKSEKECAYTKVELT